MAISKGKTSVDFEYKKYYGVAPVKVLAVNPNKKELEGIYNTEFENSPEYVGTTTRDEKEIPQVRIDFVVKTVKDSCGVELLNKLSFFLCNSPRYNKDKSKMQIIDKYGRTAWATPEEVKNKVVPTYKNGAANIDKDFRPAYIGEEDLIKFIITYLGIPRVDRYINGTWEKVDNPEECEARLEHISDYFKGDFSELKEAISFQPNNKVKVLFGVRSTEDNRQYQTIYPHFFLKSNTTKYDNLAADVQSRKNAGGYSNVDFFIGDLKEYAVEPTEFTQEQEVSEDTSDLPFDTNSWFNA